MKLFKRFQIGPANHGLISGGFAACLVAALIACASGSYGGLKHNREVAHAFETFHVDPEYRYYYLNQENNPYAVVGLKKEFTLQSKLWNEVDPQSETFEKVVGLVESFPVNYSHTYGSYILDPKGEPIGVWYSSLRVVGIRVNEESRTVSINTETPWLRDDDGFGPGVGVGVGVGTGGGVRIGF